VPKANGTREGKTQLDNGHSDQVWTAITVKVAHARISKPPGNILTGWRGRVEGRVERYLESSVASGAHYPKLPNKILQAVAVIVERNQINCS
jgi:hypothetical protein